MTRRKRERTFETEVLDREFRVAKYRNRKRGAYDSTGEGRYADQLRIRELAGEISDLRTGDDKERILISPPGCEPIHIEPDYTYVEHGVRVVEDFKAPPTLAHSTFRLKWRLLRAAEPDSRLRIVMERRGVAVVVSDTAPGSGKAFTRQTRKAREVAA